MLFVYWQSKSTSDNNNSELFLSIDGLSLLEKDIFGKLMENSTSVISGLISYCKFPS